MAAKQVIVVGGGNAALCAALSAAEHGANVTVIEKAAVEERGGNTFFTGGGFRFPYNGIEDIQDLIPDLSDAELNRIDVGNYSAKHMSDDLLRVSEGAADPDMVNRLVSDAFDTVKWMRDYGLVRWVLMYGRQAYEVDGILKFWGGMITEAVGAGEGLSDALYAAVERQGIDVKFGTKMTSLLTDSRGAVNGIRIKDASGISELSSDAVVLAAGGFQANVEMRTRYLGPGWEFAKIRGSRHNTGEVIRSALEIGAQPFGHWSSAHAVAWDLNAPPTGNRRIGDLYQKHSYPLGIVVNTNGDRFVDEGADMRNYTYAKYGREILKQPYGVAFQIFDQQTAARLRDEYRIREVTKAEASTLEELAASLGIQPKNFVDTVNKYNEACQGGSYDPAVLDGLATAGITPPKSNWALPLSEPPFIGFAVTCGITFTFGGLRANAATGQVLDTEDLPITGLYAAGELLGGLFYHNYAGGTGLMAGSVFGRIAGRSAAK